MKKKKTENVNGKKPVVEFKHLTVKQQALARKYGYDPAFPAAEDMAEGNNFVKKSVQDNVFTCPGCTCMLEKDAGRFVLLGILGLQRLVNRRAIALVLDDEDKGPKILMPGVVV